MIKLVYTMGHRDGTTREEFQSYWREHHALLVKTHAETLQIRRYVQVHARDTGLDEAVAAARGSEPRGYDGVAELWWTVLTISLRRFQATLAWLPGTSSSKTSDVSRTCRARPSGSEKSTSSSPEPITAVSPATAQRRIDGRRVA